MSTPVAEEYLNDPIALAIAVLVARVRELSKEDRADLFQLTEALSDAKTEEEYEAAARGMREVLRQEKGSVREMESAEPGGDLERWMAYAGERIKALREKSGLTQQQLAEKAGLPQSHISRLESKIHSPSATTVEKIAKALGVEPSAIDPSL
jgi:ribosome-binding protein aMBF1 (putative translation factor)